MKICSVLSNTNIPSVNSCLVRSSAINILFVASIFTSNDYKIMMNDGYLKIFH